MRLRRLAAAITVGLLLVLAPAAGAWATAPVQFGAGYVVDEAGALSGAQATQAQQRLEDLYTATGVDLYAAFVDTFTDPADRQDWADTTASDNGMGDTQYLLAVATTSRQYTISAADDGPLDDAALDRIEAQIKPKLSDGDYLGAVTTAADAFEQELGSTGAAGAGSSGIPWGGLTVVLLLVVLAGILVWLLVRSRRKKAPAGASATAPEPRIEDLQRQAGSALVQADDAIRTSEQELGFARAQFGDAATEEFAAALVAAKTALDQAFALRQKLDDNVLDTPAQIREWNTQIIQLCAQADQSLDEKAAAFDELRKLEQDATAALARIRELREQTAQAMDAATAEMARLQGAYAREALATVADNITQAGARLTFADEQLAAADTALAAGESGQAAVAVRAAEQAVDQARTLQEAIGKLGADLDRAAPQIAALIVDLEGDVAAASALPDQGAVGPVTAAVRAQIDAARADQAAALTHPLATLQALESVNTQIDGVLKNAQDAAERTRRAQQMLGQMMAQAQAQVSAAEDYIVARRGAIGATARTRLAQAGAELVQAQQLQASDTDQALAHAQRADQLAGQALQAAQSDVSGFGGFGGQGGQGGSGTGQVVGAVLGGILINSLLGGGGGFGGGRGGRRGGGGFSPGSFGGGGFSPGSFGGGGTRSRRGGGRF